MTFAECLAGVIELADGVGCRLEVSAWGGPNETVGVRWVAYRVVSWDGDRAHIEAGTPEMLLERIRDARATDVTKPDMTVDEVCV